MVHQTPTNFIKMRIFILSIKGRNPGVKSVGEKKINYDNYIVVF